MITPDGPAPTSPILGDEAAALGFPPGVQVIKMSNAPGRGPIGEAWACVTDPRRQLLGWCQRVAGTTRWQIIAEPMPGSQQPAALFDEVSAERLAASQRAALGKLAELARITVQFVNAAPADAPLPPRAQAAAVVAALEGPRVGGGPYLETIEIAGVAYAYRPLTLAEIEAMATQFHAGGNDAERVATAMGVLRSVLAPEAVEAVVARMRDGADRLDYTHVLEALGTIVGRRGMDDPEARAKGLEARGYVHHVIIGGVAYLHRLMSLDEVMRIANVAGGEADVGARVAAFWAMAKRVIEAGDVAALEARMADPTDEVTEADMIAALTEIAEKG